MATVSPARVKDIFQSFIVNSSEIESKETDTNNSREQIKPKVPVKLPNPRDKDEYFRRVASYSSIKWSAKPLEATPLQCAKYGWINIDIDVLKCVSCHAIVHGKLPRPSEVVLYKEGSSRLVENILKNHLKFCPWPTNPSPDSFFELSHQGKDELKAELVGYIENVRAIQERLPCVQDEFEAEIEDLQKEVEETLELEPCLLQVLQIALRGWNVKNNSVSMSSLYCLYCTREVGLWNYTSHLQKTNGDVSLENEIEETIAIDDENGEPVAKRQKVNSSSRSHKAFNPLKEHKHWCPWLAAVKRLPTADAEEGWRAVLNIVLSHPATGSLLKTPPGNSDIKTSINQLRQIRTILNDWSSPTSKKPPESRLAVIRGTKKTVIAKSVTKGKK